MANVFGTPITDKTLEEMPEYSGKKITQTDRARVALSLENAENKELYARKYVEKLKADCGLGVGVPATSGFVYNAAGITIKFVTNHDYAGHVVAKYPEEIANGQLGAFLHIADEPPIIRDLDGSVGAVVYHLGKCDWMMAWCNPLKSNPLNGACNNNKAYTEIREAGHYSCEGVWKEVLCKLRQAGSTSTDKGYNFGAVVSITSNGINSNAIFKGKIKLHA